MELYCRPCPTLPTVSYLTLITILWGRCYSHFAYEDTVYVCPVSLCYTALGRTQYINSGTNSRIQASFLHGEPYPGLPPGSLLLQDRTFRSIPALLCFSLCVRGRMSRNHIPQTHLLAACRHCWEISWQGRHSIHPQEWQFQATAIDCVPAALVVPRWQEWELVPPAVSSCLSCMGQICGSFLVSGISFMFLPFGFYSPCSKFPVANSSA